MARFVRLSHEIRSQDPGWPGNPTYSWEHFSSIADGAVANVGVLHLGNHFGSHLDAPNHFNADGRQRRGRASRAVRLRAPRLLDVPKGDASSSAAGSSRPNDAAIAEADVLLLRTGWSEIRKSDPVRYAHQGPGVSPEACTYLMDGFPGLKALALDCISLAAYQRIDPEGIVAHQILCGVGRGDRYVLIIEDLDLAAYPPGPPARLYAIPLFPEGTDSSPCTVFAELA